MKKSQAIQFNWIFIVFTGVILIIFFSIFGFKYAALQKNKENAEIGRTIDKVMNGLKSAEQYKTIDVSTRFNMEFNCNSFKVNDDYEQTLDGKIVFMDPRFNGNKLYAWTKEFSVAYNIDNLVYLIDPKTNYYIISDGKEDFIKDLKDEMPNFDNIFFISYSDLLLEDIDKKSKFIFFLEPNNDQINYLGGKGEIVYFDNDKIGLVHFYNENKQGIFIKKSLMYGAIFSNYDNYNCAFDRLVNKFDVINNIYTEKTSLISNCCSNALCDYSKVNNDLKTLKKDILNRNYDSLYIDEISLVKSNSNLYDNNCRVIF